MNRSYCLSELANLVDADFKGDSGCLITGISTIQDASGGDISFLANPKYKKYLATTKASVLILDRVNASAYSGNIIIAADPYLIYAKISQILFPITSTNKGIDSSAHIGENCNIATGVSIAQNATIMSEVTLGEGVRVSAGAVVGNKCLIGANSVIMPNVTILDNCEVGKDCIIHSGVVIGGDGFGFAQNGDKWEKISQIGRVIIGDDVEIGANTTIDRGAIGDTIISNGVKIDNLIQIGHNVKIGENTAIAACAAIAGSAEIGANCTIAGKAGIVGHISICDNTYVKGMSLISKSIKKPGVYSSGIPALEDSRWRKIVAKLRRL